MSDVSGIGDPTPDQDVAIVDSFAARLAEHFDSVQIVVTRRTGTNSRMVSRGSGNYYASYGAVREWLIGQDEGTRINSRSHE